MSVSTNMFRSWRRPREVARSLLAQPQREDRAFGYLMAACFIIFVGQWPRLSRIAAGFDVLPGEETPEFARLIAYEFLSWMVVWPLLMYLLASVSRLIARLFGGRGTVYRSRLVLFWALLASTPALLLFGLTMGFIGAGIEANLVGAVWVLGFGMMWFVGLREAEWGE